MRNKSVPIVTLVLVLLAGVALAQQTPKPMVATYDALATAILALKDAEADFVTTVLQVHHRRAKAAYDAGDYAAAAAEMAVFANEGDNAVAGVRKRLVDGGHHHHGGESAERYDTGFVVVTREAKRQINQAASAMRSAGGAPQARQAWESFDTAARSLIAPEEE